MSTIGDELSSPVPAGYTERPAYGRVPDPITLFDAALLIARDPASGGRSHAEVFAGLIGAFWRGEIPRGRRSLVFTLKPPRTRVVRSEPGQTMADIIASPPPGTWLDRDGRVYRDKDGRISQVRRRTTWTRQEVLETLIRSENLPNSYSPPLAVDADDGSGATTEGDRPDIPRTVSDWTLAERKAAYRILAETPLQDWSEYIRALLWDRLCITLRDLAFWIAARGEHRPGFLIHVDPDPKPAQQAKKPAPPTPANWQSAIDVETECEEWLVTLMANPWNGPKKKHLAQARERWPGLTEAEFGRAWSTATKKTGSDWTRPGRRRRR